MRVFECKSVSTDHETSLRTKFTNRMQINSASHLIHSNFYDYVFFIVASFFSVSHTHFILLANFLLCSFKNVDIGTLVILKLCLVFELKNKNYVFQMRHCCFCEIFQLDLESICRIENDLFWKEI